jgi:hypothetical protein
MKNSQETVKTKLNKTKQNKTKTKQNKTKQNKKQGNSSVLTEGQSGHVL